MVLNITASSCSQLLRQWAALSEVIHYPAALQRGCLHRTEITCDPVRTKNITPYDTQFCVAKINSTSQLCSGLYSGITFLGLIALKE